MVTAIDGSDSEGSFDIKSRPGPAGIQPVLT
jgi:hypothetical protein